MSKNTDAQYLQQCIALAAEALAAGNQPFGSILVSAGGEILFEAKNEVATAGDNTRHPEFAIARWATENLSKEERAASTVYTSGEHCPMCAAAHGWVGLGRIVYATSAAQLGEWQQEFGAPAAPIRFMPVQELVPGIEVVGPFPEFAQEVKALQKRSLERQNKIAVLDSITEGLKEVRKAQEKGENLPPLNNLLGS